MSTLATKDSPVTRILQAVSTGAVGAIVGAIISAVVEPVVNRVLVRRMTL